MSLFERTAKINRILGPLAALLGAAAWFQPAVAGSDLWWHLASGREIWAHGGPLSVDPFSYTFGGREWLNHEWLWDAIYWGVYQVHPQSVGWLNLIVVLAIFWLGFELARRTTGSALAAGASIWLAAAASHWFLDIRPHLITLLLVGIVLITRERRWAPWLWPGLVVAWANLHGGFVFGIGTIGLLALVRTVELSVKAGRLTILRLEWISVSLCLVAWLINPWGFAILDYPLQYLDSASPYRSLIEWHPPVLDLGRLSLRDFHNRFWLAALLALVGAPFAARRWPHLVALSAVTLAMAVTSRRFIPLFTLTAAPLVALPIALALKRLAARRPALVSPSSAIATSLVALLTAAALWQDVRLTPGLLERWTQSDAYPQAAARYLVALGSPRRLLNYYNWGGYLMLHVPESKLFIDGRANTLYDEEIYGDYRAFLAGQAGMSARLARYRADAAILPAGGRFASALTRLPVPWTRIYSDRVAMILLPPGSPLLERPLPLASRVLAGEPDQALARASAAARRGDIDAAIRQLEEVIRQSPLLIRAYLGLTQLLAQRGDRAGVQRIIGTGLRNYPRRRTDLRLSEARAYEQLGDLPAALRAYRQGLPTGPFASPRSVDVRMRQLQEKIDQAGTIGTRGEGR